MPRAEPGDDGLEPARARLDRLAREPIGVDERDPQRGEARRAVGLPRRDPSGQGRKDHGQRAPRRALAAVTVFFSSIAIVSGPTPPGTGVKAPATLATFGMNIADDDRSAPLEVREPR